MVNFLLSLVVTQITWTANYYKSRKQTGLI